MEAIAFFSFRAPSAHLALLAMHLREERGQVSRRTLNLHFSTFMEIVAVSFFLLLQSGAFIIALQPYRTE